MGWLDPIECLKAREYLAEGNLVQAAHVLLASKTPDHKAVRQLLLEIQRKLLVEAESQYRAGHLEPSWKLVELAKQCGELPADVLAFVEELNRAVESERRRRAWQQAQLTEAKRLANAGHLDSAIHVLERLSEMSEAKLLQSELCMRRERFRRAIDACRQCLEQGDPHGARRHWEKARELIRDHPEVFALAREIARLSCSESPWGGGGGSVPITQPSGRFILAREALVILDGEIGIGTPRTPGVKLPLLGRIHSRHAVLFRDRRGWQITPCTDKHGRLCLIWVNGEQIGGPRRLASGDEIALGTENLRWSFSLPCPGSLTAVLVATSPASGTIWVGAGPSLRKTILLVDELVIRPHQPAHLVLEALPCEKIRLVWKPQGLCWEVDGGEFLVELPQRTVAAEEAVAHIPSCVVVQGNLSEAESLGRMVAGITGVEPCRIEVEPCERVTSFTGHNIPGGPMMG